MPLIKWFALFFLGVPRHCGISVSSRLLLGFGLSSEIRKTYFLEVIAGRGGDY